MLIELTPQRESTERLWTPSRETITCIAFLATALLFASGCGLSQPAARRNICATELRTPALNAQMEPRELSTAFVIAPNQTVWVQVTLLPRHSEGPLGQLPGPVANLYYVAAGNPPRMVTSSTGEISSPDPVFPLEGGPRWQEVGIPAGNWQVYSNTDPGISIVTCPKQ